MTGEGDRGKGKDEAFGQNLRKERYFLCWIFKDDVLRSEVELGSWAWTGLQAAC